MKKLTILAALLFSCLPGIAQSSQFVDFFYRQTTYGDTQMPTIAQRTRIIYGTEKAVLYDITNTRVSDPTYFKASLTSKGLTWYYYEDDNDNAIMIEVYGRYGLYLEQYDANTGTWNIVSTFSVTVDEE